MVQRLKFKWFESSTFNVQRSTFEIWFKIVLFCFQIVESLRATTSIFEIIPIFEQFYNSMILTILQYRA